MEWHDVVSSFIEAIGYNEDTLQLHVKMANGTYIYNSVPRGVFERFLTAPSKGKFLHNRIKGYYD